MIVIHRVLTRSLNKRTLSAVFLKKSYSSESYLKSSYPDIDIPRVHITECIFDKIDKWPDKIITECAITGRKYTYDEMRIKATNLNKSLRKKLKLERGDVVALLIPNLPEFPICVFGIFLAGLKLTTINPAYTPEEIMRQLHDSNAKVIITITSLWKNVTTATDLMRKKIPTLIIKTETSEAIPQGALDFNQFVNETCAIHDVKLASPDEVVFMPYSSGTTGLPKGVEITNQNIVSNLYQLNAPAFKLGIDATETHQDVVPSILPLFHIYGFTSKALNTFITGGKLVTLPSFTPDTFLSMIIKYKPHILMLVPPIIIFLSTHPSVKSEYFKSLRTLVSGAAPLGAIDEEKFRHKVGKPVNIIQGYGLTETSPCVALVPTERQGQWHGSVGTIVPNTQIKIVDINDPEAKHLGPNKTGELLVKGPQVMKGYHNRPEETESSFHDGWFRTGDMLYYNDEGMLYIADRIKELIKVKGFQVPPAELEEIIRNYPGVADAAVIGIPHEYSGEVPRAYIVKKKGESVDAEKLTDFVESKVAHHKKLKGGIAFIDSIPKTGSGKILRRQLKLGYQEKGI